jgi:acyl-coenzyme A synthetase/AMP-(fatty) acid ligase
VHVDSLALIMFTSGSTSTPKPVPFTHGQLLWSLEHNQQQVLRFQEALSAPGAGTLSFLPNFHVIGFLNNFTSNIFWGLRCAVLQDVGSTMLTPQVLLEACPDLRPTLIDSVPVMVEGLFRQLDRGHVTAEQRTTLERVAAIMAGGCQLNEGLLAPLAQKHGVQLRTHYGQTEAGGGTPMFGGIEGAPSPPLDDRPLDDHPLRRYIHHPRHRHHLHHRLLHHHPLGRTQQHPRPFPLRRRRSERDAPARSCARDPGGR